ncbi:unnamed protein product [Arctogadus glacialis]
MNRSRHYADPDLNTGSLTRLRPTVQYLIHEWFTQFTGNTDVKKWFGAMEFTSRLPSGPPRLTLPVQIVFGRGRVRCRRNPCTDAYIHKPRYLSSVPTRPHPTQGALDTVEPCLCLVRVLCGWVSDLGVSS